MGDGNDLAGSEKMKRPSVRVHADLLERFDEWCEENDTSRSAALRDYMQECVAGDGHGEPGEWLPSDETDRGLYLTALELSSDRLVLNLRRERGRLAEKTKVAKEDIHARLRDLERDGYVSQLPVWNVRADLAFRIKPRCADPDEWVPGGLLESNPEAPDTEGSA